MTRVADFAHPKSAYDRPHRYVLGRRTKLSIDIEHQAILQMAQFVLEIHPSDSGVQHREFDYPDYNSRFVNSHEPKLRKVHLSNPFDWACCLLDR
jgi:hypothetical protein